MTCERVWDVSAAQDHHVYAYIYIYMITGQAVTHTEAFPDIGQRSRLVPDKGLDEVRVFSLCADSEADNVCVC